MCLFSTCFFRSSSLFTVENDRKNRSTNLHQVLLQSRQELYGDVWNDTEGLCGWKYGHKTDKGVVQAVKKHVKVGVMSSQCWLFFLIVRVLWTANLLQEVRRSTKNITLKLWKDCVMPWEENDLVSGQAVTTITRQRIHRTLCSKFDETQDCTASPASVDVPKIENGAQGRAVRRHRDKICVRRLL